MKTLVDIELFKDSGKFYTSFQFETETECHDIPKLKSEAMAHNSFIKEMNFTLEVTQIGAGAWNKYLYIANQ